MSQTLDTLVHHVCFFTDQHVGVVGGCGTVCSLLFIKSRLMTSSRPKPTTSMSASYRHALLIGCGNGSLYVTDCSTPNLVALANRYCITSVCSDEYSVCRVGVVDDAVMKLLVTPALPELVSATVSSEVDDRYAIVGSLLTREWYIVAT